MKLATAAALACPLLAALGAAHAQTLATQVVQTGINRPVWLGAAPGDTNRIFVAEQRYRASSGDPWSGRIRIINIPTNTLNATPFLTLTPPGHAAGTDAGVASLVVGASIGEQGLLGVAFHPTYTTHGYFYVHHTRASDNAIIIARLRGNAPYATSTTADPASYTQVLVIPHPSYTNHNGGWIEFGPDGYLYASIGDGGNGNDTGGTRPTGGNAQSLTNLLGKIIRIDVDGPDDIPGNSDDADTTAGTAYRIPPGNPFSGAGQRREIWAYGLRNPWRNSFDRLTGDLWTADVGQDQREEINFAQGNPAGLNYGWKCAEGFRCTGLSNCPTCPTLPAGVTPPILDYANSPNPAIPPFNQPGASITGIAVTGGYVYRGCDIPWFRGHYLFTDYGNPVMLSFRYSPGSGITDIVNRSVELDPPGTPAINNVVSFGEDASGELYIVDATGGDILKVVPGSPTPDCNTHGCGTADFDGDGDTGTDADIEAFFACLSGNCCPTCFPGGADFNGDGDTGTDADIEAFFRVLAGGDC